MNEEFLAGAVRDGLLLVAGSAFTLLGTWIANRHGHRENERAWKRAERARASDRVRAKRELKAEMTRAHESQRSAEDRTRAESILVAARGLRIHMLTRPTVDALTGWEFPEDVLLEVKTSTMLLHDRTARAILTAATDLVDMWPVLIRNGYGGKLRDSPTAHQWQVLDAIEGLAASVARGDFIDFMDSDDYAWLTESAAEIEQAFEDEEAMRKELHSKPS